MRSKLDNQGTYLVTGSAGFVGSYVAQRLLEDGCTVVGLDNLNSYYSVDLKRARLDRLSPYARFNFAHMDLTDKESLDALFDAYGFTHVIHLAAQAGVRHSFTHPATYIESNIVGFFNVLESCRHNSVGHLLYASSSSVYGANEKVPFEESDDVSEPVSLYAATKLSNELMAKTYARNFGLAATGLRFFTVYGPMGRPDMAYFGFLDKHFAGEEIAIFNGGDISNDLYRDFTYIDDIVEGVVRLVAATPMHGQHRLFNIGNNEPVRLMEFISSLEAALSKTLRRPIEFRKRFEALKPGDVPATYASTDRLAEAVGFRPSTPLATGLQRFTDWYVAYHSITSGDQSRDRGSL